MILNLKNNNGKQKSIGSLEKKTEKPKSVGSVEKRGKKTPKQTPPKQLLVQISGLKNDGDGDCSIGMLYLNLLAIDMFNLSLERTN